MHYHETLLACDSHSYLPYISGLAHSENRLCKFNNSINDSSAVSGMHESTGLEGIKAKNRNDCYNLPQSQQEGCLEATDISFEEYQRRRKEAEENELNR